MSARGHCSRQILLLDTDNLRADALRRATSQVFPDAEIRRVHSTFEASKLSTEDPIWLLITSIDIPGADVLYLLANDSWVRGRFLHLMVVTTRREQRILLLLSSFALDGIFDPSSEGIDRFRSALRRIDAGRQYLSPGVAEALVKWRTSPCSIERVLTEKEQLILSIIGDGRDDVAAAQTLHLRPSTIQSMRRNIHRKLGISHKGELVRLAVQHGFVQFTADGVLHPGFACALSTALRHPHHVST
jgi:DNA-binding NarL/FixJ family response regulator